MTIPNAGARLLRPGDAAPRDRQFTAAVLPLLRHALVELIHQLSQLVWKVSLCCSCDNWMITILSSLQSTIANSGPGATAV